MYKLWGKIVFTILISSVDDQNASLDLAFEVSEYFDIDIKKAKEHIREIALAVSDWKNTAKVYGVSRMEIDRMSTAFEHENMCKALKV